MQQNHEMASVDGRGLFEVEAEEIDQTGELGEAEEIEAKIFEYVTTLEKTFDTIHGLSRFFKENEGFLLQQANREQLSIPAQEFISYVMKGSPSRIPQYMLESALREYERTGGDEFGNLDLFKNPILAVEEELAHQVDREQWEEERTTLLNRIIELEEPQIDQPEETDQPERESVEESVEEVKTAAPDQPAEKRESKPRRAAKKRKKGKNARTRK